MGEHSSIFTVDSGWLGYYPFRSYKLPRLVYVTEREVLGEEAGGADVVYGNEKRVKVPFINKAGHVMYTRQLYRLEWPGEMSLATLSTKHGTDVIQEDWEDQVPASILKNLPGFEHTKQWARTPKPDGTWYSLMMMLHVNDDKLPERLPVAMAYHLAVNRALYHPEGATKRKVSIEELEAILSNENTPSVEMTSDGALRRLTTWAKHPVGALSPFRVDEVLNARFTPDAEYLAALRYLKWVAEGHWKHPLLTGFDTSVRETLMGLSHEAAWLYFYTLSDCMYDTEKHYWLHGEIKFLWCRLATYLHYIGRVGRANPISLSKIDPPEGVRSDLVTEGLRDVIELEKELRDSDYVRRISHVDYDGAFGSGATQGEAIG